MVNSTFSHEENFNFRRVPGTVDHRCEQLLSQCLHKQLNLITHDDISYQGNYYQSLVRSKDDFFKFNGWDGKEIFIDEEADQILSYQMTDSADDQIMRFSFNGDPNSIEFTDSKYEKIFREFEYEPILEISETMTILLIR